jgi:hypothetical protein
MPISVEDAKSLCSETEWKTVSNSFAPKLNELSPSVAKKQANRVQRFLEKAKTEDGGEKRVEVFTESLERLREVQPDKGESEKLVTRRQKEQAAREKAKEVRAHRNEVRTKLKEKAEEEKAEKEGKTGENEGDPTGAKSSGGKSRKSAQGSQGRKGTRKV